MNNLILPALMKSSHTCNVPFLNVKNNVFAECVGDIVDVVFILDSSGSVGQENFEKVKEFVADVIQRVDMDSGAVRIGVEVFDTDARVVFFVSNTSLFLVYGSICCIFSKYRNRFYCHFYWYAARTYV